jgi:hypothetical protein
VAIREPIMPVSVRYIVNDVAAAIGFYSGTLGFKVDMNPAPGFAALSRGERIQIEVADIAAIVETLKASGVQFRSPIIQGQWRQAGSSERSFREPRRTVRT